MAPTAANLLEHPPAAATLTWPTHMGRRFMLWIDTEEEFDWTAPFNRNATQVSVTAGMARFQSYIAQAGVRPIYVADYAVIEDEAASAMMRGWIEEGSADVGAHLHPWVNPPHQEEVSLVNSFAGNLPPVLERAKLMALRQRIEERLGIRPLAYRAGRYGIGANSAALLEELGFRIDSSVRSRFDYSDQHGPDFSGMPLHPWRAGPQGSLIELPLSTAFVGRLRQWGEGLERSVQRGGSLAGVLARLGLLSRIPLTPEGVTAAECRLAIDSLIDEGVPVLNFSFHSPTLEPGHTPYARSPADVERFYRWWDDILGHLARRGIAPLSQGELLGAL